MLHSPSEARGTESDARNVTQIHVVQAVLARGAFGGDKRAACQKHAARDVPPARKVLPETFCLPE